MTYETEPQTRISFSRDQEGLAKAIPLLCDSARIAGMECNVLSGKTLSFITLLCLGGEFYAYWLPFNSEYERYSLMSLLIDERHETRRAAQIMSEAARWQVRATHPDWPCQLDPPFWGMYEALYLNTRK